MAEMRKESLPEMNEREIQNALTARYAAAQGMVLLENKGVLPLKKSSKVAVYGQGVRHTVPGGTGSGSVNNRHNATIEEGLLNQGFIITNEAWLDSYEEVYQAAVRDYQSQIDRLNMGENGLDFDGYMQKCADIAKPDPVCPPVTRREEDTDTAIVVISRISGEAYDRRPVRGDYYLSDPEEELLKQVTNVYAHTIVLLNVGGVIDLSFLDRVPVDGLLLMGLAGEEGGNAAAEILSGRVNPSGRLTDTWAYHYEDYPSSKTFGRNDGNLYETKYEEGIYVGYRYFDSFGVKPRYPFGYGLSYTTFERRVLGVDYVEGYVKLHVSVKNTGSVQGKEVLQVYVSKPWGLRKKELKQLVEYGKTRRLEPGEEQRLDLSFHLYSLASWHTGKSRYFYDSGDYIVLVGPSSAAVEPEAVLHVADPLFMEPLKHILPLQDALKELDPPEDLQKSVRESWLAEKSQLPNLTVKDPKVIRHYEENWEWIDWDELTGDETASAPFALRRMTLEDKVRMVVGQPANHENGALGNASEAVPGAAGETTSVLKDRLGIPGAVMADGPAGLRLTQSYLRDGVRQYQFCTAIPTGTVLAQSFDREMLKRIGKLIAGEMKAFGVRLWLAPGMNIHRNPLCGRNFEYFSEDPLVAGWSAACLTRGVQEDRTLGVTIKHFACNNQEDNRRGSSSIVSERALREIYLKGFEIAVVESQPRAIMTSYNKINGVHAANSYDLCTEMARNEWGFEGFIMTDWTTTNVNGGSSAAKCIAAGNDLVMPGFASDMKEIQEALDGSGDYALTEEQLNQCALRILTFILAQ